MAAPLLRHYSAAITTTASTLLTVPAARALVISKLLVSSSSAATTTSSFSVWIGTSRPVAMDILVAPGQVYTETGLVCVAAETLTMQATVSGAYTIHVFGEEVDN